MKPGILLAMLLAFSAFGLFARETEQPRLLVKVTPLPVALDPDFQFRKTKLYFLSEHNTIGGKQKVSKNGQTSQSGNEAGRGRSGSAVQDASINFERQYRLYGAVTKLDEHERFGDYFDFYWRTKRPADVTLRLEYQQEQLHAHVQAQEVDYHDVRGTQKTEFKVVGDDYFDNGRVIAWRCLIIEKGRIVAETRSFLWR